MGSMVTALPGRMRCEGEPCSVRFTSGADQGREAWPAPRLALGLGKWGLSPFPDGSWARQNKKTRLAAGLREKWGLSPFPFRLNSGKTTANKFC